MGDRRNQSLTRQLLDGNDHLIDDVKKVLLRFRNVAIFGHNYIHTKEMN